MDYKTLTIELVSSGQSYEIFSEFGARLESYSAPSPSFKQNFVSVPGRNGDLDYSLAVSGYPVFNNREVATRLGFYDIVGNTDDRTINVKRFLNMFYGQEVKLRFSHLNGYFLGRCISGDYERFPRWSPGYQLINAKFNCQPFLFNNELKIINLQNGVNTITNDGASIVTPVLETSEDETQITYNEMVYILNAGRTELTNIAILPGISELIINVDGAKLEFREGSL